MPEPPVSIVIPTFNRLDLTEQCLDGLERATPPGLAEVIVVDNASTDGTPAFLRDEEALGRLRAILNSENVGFGRACNAGAAIGRGSHLLFLNNDTIVQPGWLEPMLACLEADPEIGIVGSRLVYPDWTIQHAGIVLGGRSIPDHAYRCLPADAPEVLEARDYPAVTGACLLIRGGLFQQLGGFSEEYAMYVEDIDLCFGAWTAGYRIHYCPASVVVHLENASVKDEAWRDARVIDGLSTLRRRWAGRLPATIAAECGPAFAPLAARERLIGIASAEELLQSPDLLASYGRTVDATSSATLVIVYEPGTLPALGGLVDEIGLGGEQSADLLAVENGTAAIEHAATAHFVLTRNRPGGVIALLPRYDERTVAELPCRLLNAA
jgi:GT2 family glycosyltransferase